MQILEKEIAADQSTTTTRDRKFLWVGTEIAEERSGDDGGTVQKRFFAQGFVDSDGTILLYTRDHLGSIRELVDINQVVRARYDYDPYGNVTKVSGDRDSDFLYTGHFWHQQSGLFLTLYRAYDPVVGRWISRDPLAEEGGMNLYAYVGDNPISIVDPYGLEGWTDFWDWSDFLHSDIVNSSEGAGDGILSVLTVGLWDGAAARKSMGIEGVNECSSIYRQAKVAGEAITTAVIVLATAAQASPSLNNLGREMVEVSRWGRSGLQSGDFVMSGKTSLSNYIQSFKWEPSGRLFTSANRFASYAGGETFTVSVDSLRIPRGWEAFKFIFGQYIYVP